MPIEKAFTHDIPALVSDRTISIWGQPMTIWYPSRQDLLGYENQVAPVPVINPDVPTEDPNKTTLYNQTYSFSSTKGILDYNVSKNVFYKFNWFPDKADELVKGYFLSAAKIKEECFIRTRGIEQVSYYGDMIFKVEKIVDEGKYQTLRRTYFLRPYVDKQLANLLVPSAQVVPT